ncbi:50S ribosomal protein L25/general stress protein Ctc [Brachybacterium saurashtrense]|uniref:Large ribosomal subunit protein bL25 n=1 Tax=Brachybacterium saurashtrense TaxID=556288 RepID=A0A345YLS9_9MICO|nr:50S ribosomal protein L25/general stress protein Ctc [Brachybacterium saurashtrense]AXK44881.1 50S ribosomal protein L25/general stress protein Ctc [Brachybacterium saurashtrense]RRR20838.1 50S ribosomal protein L25/general stress protein Ctc [Brachybacterium saurashtrense]
MADKLNVELREDFGKGASRRLRAENRIPAVLYGHGEAPLHLSLPGHETALAARNPNALLELQLADGSSHLALIKEIQRHPLKRSLNHLDLIIVRKGEKVEVDIPVVIDGEPVSPAIAMVDLQALTLSVDALHVPEQIEISVEGAEDGYQLFAGDVTLPKDAELVTDAEILVVSVSIPRVEEEPEDEAAEGEESESESAEESAEQE